MTSRRTPSRSWHGTEFPTKATHAQTRAHNAGLVLRALYDLGPISRAGDRPPHRPDPDDRSGSWSPSSSRRAWPSEVGRGPVDRRQGPDPRLARRRRPPRRHPRPRRADLHRGARSTSAARSASGSRATSTGADGDAAIALVHDLIDELPRPARTADPRHRRRHPGHRRRATARSAGRSTSTGPTCRSARSSPTATTSRPIVANDSRAAALATFLFGGDDRPRQPRRDQGRARHRRRPRPRWRAVPRRRLRRRRDRPRRRRARRRASATAAGSAASRPSPARPAILRRRRRRRRLDTGHSAELRRRGRGAATRRALGRRRAPPAGRLGAAIANLIGMLDIRADRRPRHASTDLGEPWLEAVRDEARAAASARSPARRAIIDGGVGEDLTLLGACALLLTRELGLTVHR